MSHAKHIPALDGLRGVAILSVFVFHTAPALPVSSRVTLYFRQLFMQGWAGVDLFFVLSGFLITGILLDTRESSEYFRNFYARRILRIFPLYYTVLAAVLIFAAVLKSAALNQFLPPGPDRKWYFLYLTNWIAVWKGAPEWGFLWHFWSLAIEEQFYLLWPLVVWLLGARGTRWLAMIGVPSLLAIRLCWYQHAGLVDGLTFGPTHMDGLLVGALCAILYRDERSLAVIRKLLPIICAGCLGIFLLASFTLAEHEQQVFIRTISYSLLAVGFGAVVLLCAFNSGESMLSRGPLTNRALMQVGTYAYGIYVFHPLIVFPARAFFVHPSSTMSWFAFAVVTWILTFLVAALSYELIESPILRLKHRFESAKPPALAARIGLEA